MAYRPTIGLEVHAELKTRTKMFCSSRNDPDETRPNVNVCPVCLGHPGTLPVINRQALHHVLRIGAAVGGELADFSEFDRKSYFYPDIPKGYQISQYQYPFVKGGRLAGVALTRVHLEEDTARSVHERGASAVDFNRAGIPLMELVTEPVIHDPETAGMFARELQLLLRTLGVGEANLEKGQMRIEANISVSETEEYGTKVEVKNLNSFRSVERAIAYEVERQTKELQSGRPVLQETRGWDESKQVTFHQRFKEGSADYRYFPEPDLPKIMRSRESNFSLQTIAASLPELPWQRRERYRTYGLQEAQVAYLSASPERGAFIDTVFVSLSPDAYVLAAHYLATDLAGLYARRLTKEYGDLDPRMFAKLITLVHGGRVSSRGAKDLLALLVEQGGDPEALAAEHNLIQVKDEQALISIVREVLEMEKKAVDEYKSGKHSVLQYLVGKAMARARGSGNPEMFRDLILSGLA